MIWPDRPLLQRYEHLKQLKLLKKKSVSNGTCKCICARAPNLQQDYSGAMSESFLQTRLFGVNFVIQKTFQPSAAGSLRPLRRVTESAHQPCSSVQRPMDLHTHAHTRPHYTERPVQSVRNLMTQILHSPTNSSRQIDKAKTLRHTL